MNWFHTSTCNLLLTGFSKWLQRFFFATEFVNKIAERQICVTLILVLCSNEDTVTFCYVPHTENPLPINQISQKQIFLQMTSYKTFLSTLKVQRSEEMPASPVWWSIFLNYQLSRISSVLQALLTGLSPFKIFQSISQKNKQTKSFLDLCK